MERTILDHLFSSTSPQWNSLICWHLSPSLETCCRTMSTWKSNGVNFNMPTDHESEGTPQMPRRNVKLTLQIQFFDKCEKVGSVPFCTTQLVFFIPFFFYPPPHPHSFHRTPQTCGDVPCHIYINTQQVPTHTYTHTQISNKTCIKINYKNRMYHENWKYEQQ